MLVNCVAYQKGSRVKNIDVEEISEYLKLPETFVWVALHDASNEELKKMQEEFDLHDLAVEDAMHGHQRPKTEEYDDSLFTVLHIINVIDDEYTIGELNIFTGKNYILTVRNRSEHSLSSVRGRCERAPNLLEQGSGFVYYAILDAIVDTYFPIVDELVYEIEKIEDTIFETNNFRKTIKDLYNLKHKTMVLKHAVSPLLEVVSKLIGGRVPKVCENSTVYLRDVYDHLIRINTKIDGLRDMITTALQVNFSMASIEDNEVNKKLAAWAAIFAVVTAFAGIWGMNFKHMPELNSVYGYPAAITLMLFVCLLLYRKFRKAKWL